MRTRWLIAVAVAAAVPVHAETLLFTAPTAPATSPGLRFGSVVDANQDVAGSITRARLVIDAGDTTTMRLTFVIAARSARPRDGGQLVLPFDVPRGARVTSMAITLEGNRELAASAPAVDARAQYREIVGLSVDPALLEWQYEVEDHERLRLEVFPVRAGHDATLELEIELPRLARLTIDPGPGRFDVALEVRERGTVRDAASWKQLAAPRDIELPKTFAFAVGERLERSHVRDGVSLLAAGALPPRRVWSGRHAGVPSSRMSTSPDSKDGIRRRIRQRLGALAHCYEQAAQTAKLAPELELQFTIQPSGELTEIRVTGTDDAHVQRCFLREMATWKYSPSTEGYATQVNYPLRFQLR